MARIYTTRQLLDPRYIEMMNQSSKNRLDSARQDRANVFNALSKTIGTAATGVGKYIDEEIGKETRRNLLGSYDTSDPLKAAAADKFVQTGDPTAMMNIDQMEKTFKAREEEKSEREAEELLLKKQLFENAVEDIDTYKNDPEKEIAAINRAIEKGIAAKQDITGLQNLLKEKQSEKEEAAWQAKVTKFEEEKAKQQLDYEKEMDENTKKIINEQIARLEEIPSVEEYNYVLNRLKDTAEKHGMRSDFKWPEEKKKARTVRTAKEEDEYQALLLDKQYDRMTIEKQQRLDKLSKLKPYKAK
jgi:hypothetical protein